MLFEGFQTSYNIDLEQFVRSRGFCALYDLYSTFPSMKEHATVAWEEAVASAGIIISRKEIPARCILNIGGEYTLGPVTLGMNVRNLLGTHYYRSGMDTNLIPQQGRWFMGSVAVRF